MTSGLITILMIKKLFPLIDILIINENEAKLISKENNLKICISKLNEMELKE